MLFLLLAILGSWAVRDGAWRTFVLYLGCLVPIQVLLAPIELERGLHLFGVRFFGQSWGDRIVGTLLQPSALGVTTIGGVVRPGEEIFQIIPLEDELLIEARVSPADIAGVQPGQAATVKLSAYDYTVFGAFRGTVEFISADTFEDETRRDAEPHYRVTLRVDTDSLTERQARVDIRPGMLAEVELHTGQKTILQYLLKPLYKSKEAFREP